MGITDFLTKKVPQGDDPATAFKTQAYQSTVASIPPILGTFESASDHLLHCPMAKDSYPLVASNME
jgi:hypothetical protein